MALKVALFTDADLFAGTERHMLDLAFGLRAAGVNVRLACPRPSALAERAEGVPVLAIQKGGLCDHTAVRTLAKLLKSGALDLVHAHNGRTALLAAVAVRWAGRGCAVATQHFLEPAYTTRRGLRGFVSRAVHGWVSRRMGHFIAISEAAKAGMLARGQATEEQISVVPNGMPLPTLAQLENPQALRTKLGLAPNALLILAAARLEPEKSLETLIAAMKDVAAADPRAVCVIAGKGSQEAVLRAQMASSGVGKAVKLIGFRGDVLALMRAADLFVLPSPNEPFGLVLIEAMSVGTPVVATRAGGPLEIVVEGETGLLVAPSEPEELARAIGSLLHEAELRRRLGAAGHARFLEKFTVERMAHATMAAYRMALAK